MLWQVVQFKAGPDSDKRLRQSMNFLLEGINRMQVQSNLFNMQNDVKWP